MDIRSIFESIGSDDPIRSAFESVGSNSFDEQKFRSWYAAWAKKAGVDPDPDNPEHYYDYRAAFSAGVEPSIDPADKQYHWPSQFKKEGHPRMVLDGVNTKTGQPVDPIRSAFEAAADLSGPQLGPPTDVQALRGEPTRNVTDAISAVVPQEPANQSFAQDKPVYTEPKLSPRPANVGGPQLSQRPPQIEPKKAVDQGIRQASADTLNFLKALKAKEVRALEERLGADDPLVVKEKAKVWDDSPAGKFQKRLEVEIAQDPLPRPEGFKGYVQDMVRALPQIGASVGATYMGGPAAGMAVTGSMIAGATERELSQARVDGKGRVLPAVKDPERRWKAAIFNAAGQSFLEQLPVSRALAAWKPGAAAKSVIAEMSKTGALGWFTETIQKVPELMSSVWARGAGKSPGQMLDEFTEGVGQALKEGAYEGAVVAPVSMLIGGGGAAMGKIKAGPQPIQADEIEPLAQAKAFGIVADKDMTEDLKAARADAVKQRDRLTDLEEPYQDEIAVADLDNKIGLYDEALRNADNMQKVRQAFEDAARQQPEDIGSQIVENEPQTEERLTDEPQQPPTLPEDQRTSEQPGEPAASGPGQQLDPVRSAFEAAEADTPAVPDFATTEDAIGFGEAATEQQVSELGRLREQTKARLDELNAVPVESRDWNAVSQEAFKSQLYREAIEASRGEHPSQLEAGRPMYWDGDGKTQLSAEDAPAGTAETDQPPQLTSEQRQAVQKIYGAEIPILRTVFGKDLADRISVELKQMIDLGGANADESLANWKARGVKPNTVLGATTFRGQRALMEISLAQDAKRQQWTFDHETFHIAAEWVLPPDQYATVLKAYGGNTEAAADGFARFMNGKSQPPEGIKNIFMQLKELLRRMGNFLRGSGFTSADKIFGDIAAGSYAGKRRAGTGMYQGKAMSADEYAPQWYSQMQKVLEAKLPGSGTPQSMKQMLESWAKKGEFKDEELSWSGVKEWLDQQSGKVTKQQLLDFLAANNVQIKEVVKSAANADSEMLYRNALSNVRFLTGSDTVTDSIEGYLQDGYSPEDAIDGALEMPETVDPELLAAVRMLQNRMGNHLKGAATKYGAYQLPGGPLSRDTEILTDTGWKRMDVVAIGDTVLSRKDSGGKLEWVEVENVPTVYAEKMYHFKSQSVDMVVTPCHQMVVQKRCGDQRHRRTEIRRITAEELWKTWDCKIPLTGVWTGKSVDTIFGLDAGDVMEFIGWYISEGWSVTDKRTGSKSTIGIGQSKDKNPDKARRLESLFKRLGFSWNYVESGMAYYVGIKTIPSDLKQLCHTLGTAKDKYIPVELFQYDTSLLSRLHESMILGDGCTIKQKNKKDRIVYFTISKKLADDFQRLTLLIGLRGTISIRKANDKQLNDLYCVAINTKPYATVDDAKHAIIPYNDYAFCVTVKNHAIYVRRNGVAAFTGNSNYKEVLLTLPTGNKLTIDETRTGYWYVKKPDGSRMGSMYDTEEQAREALQFYVSRGDGAEKYKSSHWDEPNVLAHVRFNERTGPNGERILFVEEVQSDWHQEGRKKGYKGKPSDLYDVRKDQNGAFRAYTKNGALIEPLIDGERVVAHFDEGKLRRAVEYEIGQGRHSQGMTPDAPFKKTWPMLAIKRMVRYAAENGFDSIAWTPGDVQAERYDLSKQVDSIDVVHNGDFPATYTVNAMKDGYVVVSENDVPKEKLSDLIGKELAEKAIVESEPGTTPTYSGLDLKVGGEGMKGFYDKILPAEVNSFFGKKAWGNAKVGKVDLPVSRDFRKSNYGITPARDVGVNDNRFVVIDHSYGFNENGIAFGPASAEECRAWVRKEEGLDAPVSAWSLPITPQMRDKALREGMTLFNLDADNPGGMPPREPYARRPKSKNAVDLPELTEMIKVLNSGRAPKLFQRMRDALGLFQHNDLAGIADVMIDPDLVIGQPIERAVIRLKGKTPAERKASLVQQMQDFKDSVLSRYNVDPADTVFKSQYHRASGETHLSAIRKDPDVAAKVLSHELGHLDDWWAAAGDAPMVQGRGNILGRIAKLKGYINEYLAEYPGSPDEALTAADIGRLKKEAAKQKLDETTDKIIVEEIIREVPRFAETGVTAETILEIMRGRLPGESNIEVYRFLQTADSQTKKEVVKKALQDIVDERVPQTGRTQVGVDYVKETVTRRQAGKMPTQKETNERFKELLRKEIIKRKLYERMVVMDELKELTQQWKPFDLNMNKKYTAYRHKSSELYADAVSVMLQEPELLKSVAPTFDKAMKMYASVRPDFTETLEGIRKDISGSQIGPRRLSKLYEMYERGEKVIADFYIRNRMEKRSLADTLFLILTDRNHGVLKQIRAAEKSGDPELIAKARKARYELEETQYIASEMSAYVTDTVKNVIDPMMEKGATITDLGAYLFGRHVQANRKDMVSPGGHTSTTVGPMLEALEQKLGPEKYQAVKDAAEKYRKIREKYIIPRIEQSGIASPELLQTIKTRGEYARISVQHWLEEKHGKDITAQIYTPVGGALKAQKGTFSDSINAFTATLMQDISLLRSAHLNKAKTGLLDFLIDASQVKPAEMKYDKGLGRMAPVRLEDPSRAYLSIMRDGEPFTYDVHRDVAKSFEYSAYESQKATEVINALNAPLRRLLVSNNPVWMIRNIFRDFRTTIKNIPEARVKNLPELAELYKQAYGEVWEYVWKNNASDDIDALLRGKAITTDRVYGTKEMGYEDEAARIADEFNIQFNPELSKISQQRFKKARQILDVLDRFGRVSELGGKVAGYKFLKSQRDKGFINPKTGGPRTDQEIFHVVRSRIGTPDFKRQGTGQIVTNNLFMFSNVNKEGLRSALESFNEDRSAYVWKTVMYNILPKLVLAAASAQIPWVKEVVDGLTDYQKDHYTVIPIPKRLVPGLGPMDSFAFLIPEDYEGQLAGALVNKIARGEFGGTKGAINEASQLVPYRWHPAISVGADLLTYYVNGMNPVDDFRGSHILPDSIYKAGGLDAHKEMGKYVWNNLGMRLFYNARRGELDPELAPLKEALQFPVLNWLSAIATVTNRGHAERYRRIIELIRKEYARKMVESEGRIKGHINLMGYDAPRKAKVELYKALRQEDLLPSEQNFNAFEKRYDRIKNKGKDDQRIVLLEYAVTNEEKAALLSQYEMELGAEQYNKLLQNLRRDGIISQETLLKKARGDKNGRNRRTNP